MKTVAQRKVDDVTTTPRKAPGVLPRVSVPTWKLMRGRSPEQIVKIAKVAQRLLASSAKKSYDPEVDIAWGTGVKQAWGMSPEWCSLYATPLWEQLSEAQQRELTRHEAGSVAGAGIWFELILQQMLIRDLYDMPPTSEEFRWGLTELADECRHSIMFGKGTQELGVPAYTPSGYVKALGRLFKATAAGETAYASILVAEEVLDVMQRAWRNDERVDPVVREVSNIHVIEESRHMAFAREEVKAHIENASTLRRHTSAVVIAVTGYFIITNLIHKDVYKAVGLDAKQAVAAARDNEYHNELLKNSCASLMEFLNSCGLLTAPAKVLYKKAHVL